MHDIVTDGRVRTNPAAECAHEVSRARRDSDRHVSGTWPQKAGLKSVKHTDGNLNPILDDLANIVDGLHSLDPTASMDIGDVKRRYGDRLILIGNVSVDNLCTKTREEIVRETKECLRAAAPGGGYILSSSNSWYSGARLENCLAMVDAGRKYGCYPISVRD